MRKILPFLLLLLFATPAHAARRACFVTPDPVPLGSAFDVHVSGLTPDSTYWLNITQAKDPSNSGHPNWSVQTGADGTGVSTVPSTTWAPDGILVAGTAKVRAYPSTDFSPDATGTANCSFTVT